MFTERKPVKRWQICRVNLRGLWVHLEINPNLRKPVEDVEEERQRERESPRQRELAEDEEEEEDGNYIVYQTQKNII